MRLSRLLLLASKTVLRFSAVGFEGPNLLARLELARLVRSYKFIRYVLAVSRMEVNRAMMALQRVHWKEDQYVELQCFLHR